MAFLLSKGPGNTSMQGFSLLSIVTGGFLLCGALPAHPANVTEIIETPIPQATSQTCQSYSAAVLLAFENDPQFPISTLEQLRDAEVGIRQDIEDSAQGAAIAHKDIIAGFEKYTNGVYTLKEITFDDVVAAGDYIGNSTGITTKLPFPIATSAIQIPVMVSVTRIGPNTYKDGHVVTIFGIDGPPNSSREFLILNSAVKMGEDVKSYCDPDEPASQTTYSALTSWTNDIEFKQFADGKFRGFIVAPK